MHLKPVFTGHKQKDKRLNKTGSELRNIANDISTYACVHFDILPAKNWRVSKIMRTETIQVCSVVATSIFFLGGWGYISIFVFYIISLF